MNDPKVYVNGRIERASTVGVSVFDSAFQSGDQVWEGIRVYRGRLFRFEDHMDRLEESAEALQIELPLDRTEIHCAIINTLKANGFEDGVHIRLMVSRGVRRTSGMDPANVIGMGQIVIIAEQKDVAEEPAPVSLAISSIRRPPRDVLDCTLHHGNQLNSILARLDVAGRADAALMLDTAGYLAEADTANIFLRFDDTLVTPFTRSCLPGITRKITLGLAAEAGIEAHEADIKPKELASADEVFLTGTVAELVPVTSIDGRQIGDGNPGDVWRLLLKSYRELVASAVGQAAPWD